MPRTKAAGRLDEVDRIVGEWGSERPEVDASTIAIFGRVSRLLPLQRQALAELHEEHGLSGAAFDVLASLRRGGEPYRKTVGELAATSLLTSSAVTLRVDNLERDGLVRRVRTPADRRQVYVELTTAGLAAIDTVFEQHIALEREMLARLSPSEEKQLTRLLKKLTLGVEDVVRAPKG